MGGGYYDGDVAMAARSSNQDAFSYQGYASDSDAVAGRREVHPLLQIHGQSRECMNPTPIVVALDVTRSRGNDSRIMYEKLPMFIGQIEAKGYVDGPAISFCAIGDAHAPDQAPIQISQFEADNRLDEALSKIWLEEGGGGTGQESYELAAYYYARHVFLKSLESGKKGYFFFIGDEGFYPQVDQYQISNILGHEVGENVDSKQIFKELQQKFHVFFIFPKKSFEERKADIDAEIKQRVEAAGGLYKNVDVRASLIWNNRNDLDLHIIPPSGEEIFYGHKQSACGGWLDVDMNVQGESLKPVENIRWKRGDAPKGHYRVFVQNYRFHEQDLKPTPFKVEVEVLGEIRHFNSVVSPNRETHTESNVTVYEFDFDPAKRKPLAEEQDQYNNYNDTVVKAQWANVIPEEHILIIDEPESIVDVMLGALALTAGSSDLDGYMVDLKNRENSQARISQTMLALEQLSSTKALTKIEGSRLPAKEEGQKRSGKSERI